MKKKLQVGLTDEARAIVEAVAKEANEDFKNGSISLSDVVNEMILTAKVEIRALQAKHTNVRKSLRSLAAEEHIDIDLAIKALTELKAKANKRPTKHQISNEVEQ